MSNKTSGWLMNVIGVYWFIAGNPECGVTCFCTALILFSLKGE